MKQRFWKMAAALVLAVGALSRLTISQWGWYHRKKTDLTVYNIRGKEQGNVRRRDEGSMTER